MATRKDLVRWYDSFEHCKVGYCCMWDNGKSLSNLVKLGYNSGVYGWNWTAYADIATNTLYIDCYRNVPNYIREK